MMKKFYKKIRLHPDPDVFTLVLFLCVISLSLGIYNNYLIRNPSISGVNIGSDGQRYLPLKNLVKNVSKEAPSLGNKKAKVVMVEFEDLQCPYCKKFNTEVFPKIKEKYIDTGKVLFITQDLAFLGDESYMAAEAAGCANDQGMYWEFREHLYTHQGQENSGAFNDNNLKKFAIYLGLDAAKFNQCFDERKYKNLVEETKAFGVSYGLKSTPNFVINDRTIRGAMPIQSYEALIDELLKE